MLTKNRQVIGVESLVLAKWIEKAKGGKIIYMPQKHNKNAYELHPSQPYLGL